MTKEQIRIDAGDKMIEIKLINKKLANELVARWHRHNDPVPEMQISFCYGIWADAPGYKLVGVVIVGEPCGRFTGKDRNLILEVRRVCFRPDFDHKKLKRYQGSKPNSKEAPTLRLIPAVIYNGYPIQYTATTNWNFPSFVLQCSEFYCNYLYKNIKKLVTYIQDVENGSYIMEAGYYHDKTFTRRGVKKRRFMKEVA